MVITNWTKRKQQRILPELRVTSNTRTFSAVMVILCLSALVYFFVKFLTKTISLSSNLRKIKTYRLWRGMLRSAGRDLPSSTTVLFIRWFFAHLIIYVYDFLVRLCLHILAVLYAYNILTWVAHSRASSNVLVKRMLCKRQDIYFF